MLTDTKVRIKRVRRVAALGAAALSLALLSGLLSGGGAAQAQDQNAVDLGDISRPLVGGIEIRQGREMFICTLGFTVTVSTPVEMFNGIVTNSHCTESRDRLDATIFQQGGLNVTANFNGERAESAQLSGSSRPSRLQDRLLCGQRCEYSYSDASLFELNDSTSIDVNSIARPREINVLSPAQVADRHDGTGSWLEVDQTAPHFRVTGIRRARKGDVVHKVGATTGWTSGRVTDVCFDILEQSGDTILLCQSTVMSEHVFQGVGDSGSPVFVCVDRSDCKRSNEVILVGLLHSSVIGSDIVCAESDPGACYGKAAGFTHIETVLQDLSDDLLPQGQGSVCWEIGDENVCRDPASAPPLAAAPPSATAPPFAPSAPVAEPASIIPTVIRIAVGVAIIALVIWAIIRARVFVGIAAVALIVLAALFAANIPGGVAIGIAVGVFLTLLTWVLLRRSRRRRRPPDGDDGLSGSEYDWPDAEDSAWSSYYCQNCGREWCPGC